MNRSACFLLAAAAALAAQGCRPDTPRPGDVCMKLSATSQGNDSGCQSQVCVAAHQELKRDVTQGSAGLVCEHCTGIPADKFGTDESPWALMMSYESSDLDLELYFDNRVSTDYSTANLAKYAMYASGTFKTSVGNSRFLYEPFEVVGYTGGKLQVRLTPQITYIYFDSIGDPKLYNVGGVPVISAHQTCVYGREDSDGPPVWPTDTYYELAIDFNAPVTLTAY
ncbi:MAG: hypothetical protein QM778_28670 [Myxococcales bacterium]